MTKAELLAALKKKSAPVPTPSPVDGNKDSAAQPPAEKPPGSENGAGDLAKMVEAILARLDAMSEALASLLDGAKPDEEMKADEADKDGDKVDKKPNAEEPANDGEMSDEDAQKAIDDLDAKIAELEDDEA